MKRAVLLFLLIMLIHLAVFPDMIELRIGNFDTDYEVPDFSYLGLSRDVPKGEYDYYLVQFRGKVTEHFKNRVADAGAELLGYIPDNAYIVRMNSNVLNAVKGFDFIKFIQIYQPAYRVSPRILFEDIKADPDIKDGNVMMYLRCFPGEDLEAFRNTLASLKGVNVTGGYSNTVIEVSPDRARSLAIELANMKEVAWIEQGGMQKQHNAWTRWIIQGCDTAHFNAGSDRWYAATSIATSGDSSALQLYAHGIYGQGQVISIVDGGCDYDGAYFRDPSEAVWWDMDFDAECESPNLNNRKVIAYNPIDGYGSGTEGDDHGTHVTGTACGDSVNSGLPSAMHIPSGNGMAPLAKLAIVDVFSWNGDYNDPSTWFFFWVWARDAGARVANASWGRGDPPEYTLETYHIDSIMWEYKDFLLFKSAGNDNLKGDSVGTSATAKNIVTVGATESGAGSGLSSWGNIGSTSENELDDMDEYSSHGPLREGMWKPEVVTPGDEDIWSAESDRDFGTNCPDGIVANAGTSMASPSACGMGALIRQYFEEGWYPTGSKVPSDGFSPSAALVKAAMINSTRDSPGSYSCDEVKNAGTDHAPSMGQGWGRVTVDDALYFEGDERKALCYDVTSGFTSAGQYTEYSIPTGPSATEPLKVILTWTDYPATVGAGTVVVNDLDLTVTAGGNVYLGNVFRDDAPRSQTGGIRDSVNIVEGVWIDPVPNSTITVRVDAYNIPQGPQPYALVITGDLSGVSSRISYKKNIVQDTLSSGTVVSNNVLNINETADLDIWVRNSTGSQQNSVTGLLRSASANLTIHDSTGTFGTIADKDTMPALYRVSVSPAAVHEEELPCTLFVSYGAVTDTSLFSLSATGLAIIEANENQLLFEYDKTSKTVLSTDTLKYDDYETDGLFQVGETEDWYCVKFTTAEICSIKSVWWGRYHKSVQNDTVCIWPDNGGRPDVSNPVYEEIYSVSNVNTNTVYHLEFASVPVIDAGTFYVGIKGTFGTSGGSLSQMLMDASGGANSYFSPRDPASWSHPTGDMVIRAEITAFTEATDQKRLYIKNNDAGTTRPVNLISASLKDDSSWITKIEYTPQEIQVNDSAGIDVFIDTVGMDRAQEWYSDTLLVQSDADSSKNLTLKIPILVRWTDITANEIFMVSYAYNNKVILEWNEHSGNSYFVSRSGNSQQINIIDRVQASPGLNTYTDLHPLNGDNYYRLGRESNTGIQWLGISRANIARSLIMSVSTVNAGHVGIDFSKSVYSHLRIDILDITGRCVRTLLNSAIPAGIYTYAWDCTDNAGEHVSSGIYFVRMSAENSIISEKIAIIQ